MWFYQDNLPLHVTNNVIVLLKDHLDKQLIPKRDDVEWSPRLCDRALAFSLWGGGGGGGA